MKIKVNSKDVLEIAKALKCGWLDTSKIESFKTLLDGYNPHREIKRDELNYYLECLHKGWGYTPADMGIVNETMLEGLPDELLEKWKRKIVDGSVYSLLVKEAFFGLVAVKALGGTFTDIGPDFGFMDEQPPTFR